MCFLAAIRLRFKSTKLIDAVHFKLKIICRKSGISENTVIKNEKLAFRFQHSATYNKRINNRSICEPHSPHLNT